MHQHRRPTGCEPLTSPKRSPTPLPLQRMLSISLCSAAPCLAWRGALAQWALQSHMCYSLGKRGACRHESMHAHLWGRLLLGIKPLLVPWGLLQVRRPLLQVVITQVPPLRACTRNECLRSGTWGSCMLQQLSPRATPQRRRQVPEPLTAFRTRNDTVLDVGEQ